MQPKTQFRDVIMWYMIRYDIYMIWYDTIYDVIWYMIYLLTAVVLTPDGISTVHIYTNNTQNTQRKQNIYELRSENRNEFSKITKFYRKQNLWRRSLYTAVASCISRQFNLILNMMGDVVQPDFYCQTSANSILQHLLCSDNHRQFNFMCSEFSCIGIRT